MSETKKTDIAKLLISQREELRNTLFHSDLVKWEKELNNLYQIAEDAKIPAWVISMTLHEFEQVQDAIEKLINK